jgi:hypothetical protein
MTMTQVFDAKKMRTRLATYLFTWAQVLSTPGCDGVAIVSGIFDTPDVFETTRKLADVIAECTAPEAKEQAVDASCTKEG